MNADFWLTYKDRESSRAGSTPELVRFPYGMVIAPVRVPPSVQFLVPFKTVVPIAMLPSPLFHNHFPGHSTICSMRACLAPGEKKAYPTESKLHSKNPLSRRCIVIYEIPLPSFAIYRNVTSWNFTGDGITEDCTGLMYLSRMDRLCSS